MATVLDLMSLLNVLVCSLSTSIRCFISSASTSRSRRFNCFTRSRRSFSMHMATSRASSLWSRTVPLRHRPSTRRHPPAPDSTGSDAHRAPRRKTGRGRHNVARGNAMAPAERADAMAGTVIRLVQDVGGRSQAALSAGTCTRLSGLSAGPSFFFSGRGSQSRYFVISIQTIQCVCVFQWP